MQEVEYKYDLYLSGKMRGCPQLNYPIFNAIARRLRQLGYSVFNPAEYEGGLTSGVDRNAFAIFIARDLHTIINECRGIIFIPEWEDSLGANVEAFVAFVCNKGAMIINNLSLTASENTELEANFDIVSINLANYRLPYGEGKIRRFDPHKCDLHSFEQE
jgi:hypothetical protein